MLLDKETLGYISVVATLVSLAPYYYFIFTNTIKPHAFSWFIWGLLTAIGFAAQHAEGAGPGAWSTGVVSVGCFVIALLALKKGEKRITKSDWACFLAALFAIPLWYFTSDPLWSVILVSIIDVLGYFPTARKSFHKPHEELIFTHFTGTVKYVFALMAIEHWSLTTWLYPAAISTANLFLVAMLVIRRRQCPKQA